MVKMTEWRKLYIYTHTQGWRGGGKKHTGGGNGREKREEVIAGKIGERKK